MGCTRDGQMRYVRKPLSKCYIKPRSSIFIIQVLKRVSILITHGILTLIILLLINIVHLKLITTLTFCIWKELFQFWCWQWIFTRTLSTGWFLYRFGLTEHSARQKGVLSLQVKTYLVILMPLYYWIFPGRTLSLKYHRNPCQDILLLPAILVGK